MVECVPFLKVRNISQTIKWYENIGFKCTATNHIWEPDCELNWARLEWEGAAFMLGSDERDIIPDIKNTALWYNVNTIDEIIETLKSKDIEVEIETETFYGRKVISFKDLNGFGVSFSCELVKQ